MESVVVESIKSDVLQVSTPPPLVTPSHFHITPQNKVELSALSNIDLNVFVFVNLYTSVLICDNVTEAEAVGAVEGGGSAPGGQP